MRNTQSTRRIGVVCLIVGFIFIISGALVNAQQSANQVVSSTSDTTTSQQTSSSSTQQQITPDTQQTTPTTDTSASTANPYPPNIGSLALNDPMQDNSKGDKWDESTDSLGGTCGFTGGTYHAVMPAVNSGGLYSDELCTAQNTSFTNFAFQINMNIITPNGGVGGGVSFREQGQMSNGQFTQLTCYLFVLLTNGSYALESYNYSGSGSPKVNTLTNGNTPVYQGGSTVLGVVAQGSNITIYVNKQQIATVTDNSFSSGQIGVFARGVPTAGVDVAFSNAQVWTL